MKHRFHAVMSSTAMLFLVLSAQAGAQSLSPWEYNVGEGVVALPAGVKSRGGANNVERLPVVYKYARVPDKDKGWKPAPLVNGKIAYGSAGSSILPKETYNKFTHVDFTYFRAYLDVPAAYKVSKAEVTIGSVDDQARVLLFNSNHIDGLFVAANDGKRGGTAVTTDFSKDLLPGEINTFVIIQVDDNPSGNTLTGGISVKLNNAEIAPDPNWTASHQAFTNKPGYAQIKIVTAGDAKGPIGDGEYVITPPQPNKGGAVWTSTKVDLGNNFTINAEIYLGNNDGGADGVALLFQGSGNQLVGKGGELGYKGVSPSFIVEFDTYQNGDFNDPPEDHVGIRMNGDPKHTTGDAKDFKTMANLEDGKYHPISFIWYADSQTFDLKVDNALIFQKKGFANRNAFDGKDVYFGFTAATGALFNEHKVKSISLN